MSSANVSNAKSAQKPLDAASCASYGSVDVQRLRTAPAGQQPPAAQSSADLAELPPQPRAGVSAFAAAGRRRMSFAGSESSYIGLTQPRARSVFTFGGPFMRGADAMFSLATGSLLISTGATIVAEGAYAGVRSDTIAGAVITGAGVLATLSSEHSVARLVAPLGHDAPKGLRGAHVLTNTALALGSAMTQIGAMRNDLLLELNGLLIMTAGWVGYSRTVGLICDAIAEVQDLQQTPVEELTPRSARSTYDLIGSPWAFAGVLLGSYALGRGVALDSRSLLAAGLVLAAYGWLHNAHARNPDNRAGLAATTVGAYALGQWRDSDNGALTLIAGVVTGLGAIHALYHASSHPYAQRAAHRWYAPEHFRVTPHTPAIAQGSTYSDARAAGSDDEGARGARRG